MQPISILFGNPAVKILEARLWQAATIRYLGQHPADANSDTRIIMGKVESEYKDAVAAKLREADHKVRAKWGEFKHVMMEDLRSAVATVFRMSYVDWYSIEFGHPPYPDVIAAPYQLLKHMTADVLFQILRKDINFEDLNDETLEALAAYAADQRLLEVLQKASEQCDIFEIGDRGAAFVIAEIIEDDPYFLGDDKHHSLADMVILAASRGNLFNGDRNNQKAAVKKWFQEDRHNRPNERRFTGDGWEIRFGELKSWASMP